MSKYSSRFWQHASHGNVIIDDTGVIVYTNESFNKIFGYEDKELFDKKINVLIPEPYNNRHDTILREFHSKSLDEQRMQFENSHKVPAVKKDGSMIYIDLSVFNIGSNKYGASVRVIKQKDINEKIQEQTDRNVFAANISHELRTPLNSIINMNVMLEKLIEQNQTNLSNIDYDNCMDHITTVKRASTLLLTQINDVLDYSKLMAHKMELRAEEMSLMQCIDMVIDIHSGRAQEKNIEIIASVDPEIPDILIGDRERLAQVLINLTSNAIKFTDEGKIYIKASLVEDIIDYTKPCKILIRVKDTGIGIPVEKHNQLFKAFQQLDDSHTKRHPGTGLGLVICRKICELMGGQIYLKSSELGKGSIFEMELPFEVTQKHAIVSEDIQLKGKMVLVVDDEEGNLTNISSHLMKWGMTPFQANGGEMAMVYVKQHFSFDLALVDIRMPKMSGIELMRKMKSYGVKYPILALSSYGTEFPESGEFADISEKPIVESKLYKFITRNLYPGIMRRSDPLLKEPNNVSILVAEDNVDNQKVISGLLKILGYTNIHICDNGRSALEELEKNEYSIVLLDIKMPDIDGLTAAKVINNNFGMMAKSNSIDNLPLFQIKQKTKPILIALTAVAAYGEKDFYIKDGGMDDYISKPINIDILKNTLIKYI